MVLPLAFVFATTFTLDSASSKISPNLATEMYLNSHERTGLKIPGPHNHANWGTTSLWITFLAYDYQWNDVVTETKTGNHPDPATLDWNSEFNPVGTVGQTHTVSAKTIAIPPQNSYSGWLEYSNWQELTYSGGIAVYFPPAVQSYRERDQYGAVIWEVTRESNVRKNFEYKHKFSPLVEEGGEGTPPPPPPSFSQMKRS